MTLGNRQLQAVLDACLEAQAGELDGWDPAVARALPTAINTLKAEFHRRGATRRKRVDVDQVVGWDRADKAAC